LCDLDFVSVVSGSAIEQSSNAVALRTKDLYNNLSCTRIDQYKNVFKVIEMNFTILLDFLPTIPYN